MSHVLIVEDDAKIAEAMGLRLAASGYSVETAHDAVTATMRARQNPPMAVVLDISLPGGDGFTVAERLRLMPECSQLPIVFITASKQEGLRERAQKLGAVAFLEKPFGAAELLDALTDLEEKMTYC